MMKPKWGLLAPEIVFEILQHFLPGLNLPITKPQHFPWYLGQICSGWRNVFVSYPQFWSTLVIELEDEDAKQHVELVDLERALSVMETSLRRSGVHPISFRFDLWGRHRCPSISQTPEALFCGQILDATIAHSSHWQDVYFSLHICEFEKLYKAKNRLPLLRSFQCQLMYGTVLVREGEINTNMESFTDLFVDAPRLTRIYLSDGKRWNINWSSINTIHFFIPPSPSDLLDCLGQVGPLEELAIRTELSPLALPDAVTPFHLPFLKILQIPNINASRLFHNPSLEELYIRDDMFPCSEDASLHSLSSSSFGSFPTLKKLSFYAEDVEDFRKLVQILPPAKDLYLHIKYSTVLEALSECSRAHDLEALTLRVWTNRLQTLGRILCSWKRQSRATAGFGPFENLSKISLVLASDDIHRSGAEDIADTLEHHFSEQGIEHTIQILDHTAITIEQDVPRFNLL